MPSPPNWWANPYWALTGILLGFTVVGMLSIGIFLLPIVLALVLVGSLRGSLRNRSAFAILGGLAAAPGYVAWQNRGGPGLVCHTTPNSTKQTSTV